MNDPAFEIGQFVTLSEQCAIYGTFPLEQGKILERRYSPEQDRWVYMVQFEVGTYPLPEIQLQATLREKGETSMPEYTVIEVQYPEHPMYRVVTVLERDAHGTLIRYEQAEHTLDYGDPDEAERLARRLMGKPEQR